MTKWDYSNIAFNLYRLSFAMGCEVEFTDDFGDWWSGLNEKE